MHNVGIGLRAPHYQDATAAKHEVGFFEVHSENYFGAGGAPHRYLTQITDSYPLSFHGVGLSLGSTDELCAKHLSSLNDLIDRYQPMLVSEHLSWTSVNGAYLHDLLPLPMTRSSVDHLVARISQTQDALKRQILVENASTYLEFESSDMPEWEFITEIAHRSGCGILLDVNNIYVNSRNHGFDPNAFIDSIPPALVGEMHLAGHTVNELPEGQILIDTHDQRVCDAVWDLYRSASRKFPHAPTLIEWDTDLPAFEVLLDEAAIAQSIRQAEAEDAAA